jgi:hypothetical protein
MAFRAHLVLLIKERGFANAAHVAWEITKRLRRGGLEAYVASIDRPEPPSRQRQTSQRKKASPRKRGIEAGALNSASARSASGKE